MKYILALAVVAIVGVGLFSTVGKEVTYTSEVVREVATTTVEQAVDPIDVLDEAQEALDKANQLLDEEEARLLAERDELESSYQAQRQALDARLEEIVKKRSSF